MSDKRPLRSDQEEALRDVTFAAAAYLRTTAEATAADQEYLALLEAGSERRELEIALAARKDRRERQAALRSNLMFFIRQAIPHLPKEDA